MPCIWCQQLLVFGCACVPLTEPVEVRHSDTIVSSQMDLKALITRVLYPKQAESTEFHRSTQSASSCFIACSDEILKMREMVLSRSHALFGLWRCISNL